MNYQKELLYKKQFLETVYKDYKELLKIQKNNSIIKNALIDINTALWAIVVELEAILKKEEE